MDTALQKTTEIDDLPASLQQAIDIEMSTIPLYLYTYYSINREPDQSKIIGDYTAKYLDAGMSPEDAKRKAQAKSVDIVVYANKAGATIMSVVIEEMLHMALAANLHRALAGMPKLVGRSPTGWPVNLPGRIPPMHISITPFSADQLYQFIAVENPYYAAGSGALPPDDWVTIGEFYDSLMKFIDEADPPLQYSSPDQYPQLGPGLGYYTHNNVDTLYYNHNHKQVFVNADDSGDLVLVKDTHTANKAIKTIVHQGEGYDPKHEFDDPSEREESHYWKFKELEDTLSHCITAQDLEYFVLPVPENPVTADYPQPIQSVSNLLNAVYTYTYMMMEACYRQPLPGQSEIFNFGMHKTMIFILSTLCDYITKLPIESGKFAGKVAAPTFENYAFNPATSAKSQLVSLFNAVPAELNIQANLIDRLESLPDVDIAVGENISFA